MIRRSGECAIGRPTVPSVYTLLCALYVKLTERMQRLSDCASVVHVHVHVCTCMTADVIAVSWDKSLAQFTGPDNPQNCSNSVQHKKLIAQKFPLLQYFGTLANNL